MRALQVLAVLSALGGALASDPLDARGNGGKKGKKGKAQKEPEIVKDFNFYKSEGARRWGNLQTALADKSAQDEPLSDFCENQTPKWYIGNADAAAMSPGGRFQGFLQATQLPFSQDAKWFELQIGYPWDGTQRGIPGSGDAGVLRYDNYYNPTDNVIVAEDIWKDKSKKAEGKNLQPWSRVTWTMWSQVKERNGGGSPGDVQALVHYSCVNDAAKTVAEWICTDDEANPVQSVNTYLPETDEFNAALGIENGATASGLLTHHRQGLGFKSIKDITVWCDASNIMGVSYNFT
jgi:hypothetical protein